MKIRVNGKEFNAFDVMSGEHEVTISTDMSYTELVENFTEGVKWSYVILEPIEEYDDEKEEIRETVLEHEYNCDIFSIPGPITDYRNGNTSIIMKKMSIEDVLDLFKGVL